MIPPGAAVPPRVLDHLLDCERIVLWRRQHPAVWLGPAMVFLATLVVGGWLRAEIPTERFGDLVAVTWLAAAFFAVWRVLEWQMFCFVLTDRRVMLFHGVLTRKIAMMPNAKVTDLTYQQTPFGALLRYGDLIVESAGQDQALRQVSYLPRPYQLYRNVSHVLFCKNSSPGEAAAIRADD